MVISILNSHTLYSNTINYLINKINLITSNNTKEHNAIITREYCMIDDIDWMFKKKKWTRLKSIGLVRNTIEKLDKIIIEDRCYIISFSNDIELFSKSIRLELGIENNLHVPLDIIFKIDNIFKLLDVSKLKQLKNTQV